MRALLAGLVLLWAQEAPESLRLADSEFARRAFGDVVVDHYLNAARLEQQAFESAVTDWELHRSFERT